MSNPFFNGVKLPKVKKLKSIQDHIKPTLPENMLELLIKMLMHDPKDRATTVHLLKNDYFNDYRDEYKI